MAAFIVVAIIAAILLVTSVRSQAAVGWLRAPAVTVADVPSAEDVWSDTTHQVGQTVRHGLVLVRRVGAPVTAGPALVLWVPASHPAQPEPQVARHATDTQAVEQSTAAPAPVSGPSPGRRVHAAHAHVAHAHVAHLHAGHDSDAHVGHPHVGHVHADHGRHLGWVR